jgi:hypothetical protein
MRQIDDCVAAPMEMISEKGYLLVEGLEGVA